MHDWYGGAQTGPRPPQVDVGNPDPIEGRIYGEVLELTCGQQYYFVCVAVNDKGVESQYSKQVAVIPDGIPNVPLNIIIFK